MPRDDILEKAIARYARDCEAQGAIFQQPSTASTIDRRRKRVELANVNGTLARYTYKLDALDRVRFTPED